MGDGTQGADALLLAGDGEAFAAFYRLHEDAVLAFFTSRVGAADLAADLTAETFARALAGRERFDPALGDAGGWLHGISRNVLSSSLRRGRVEDVTRRKLRMERLVLDDAAIATIDALSDEAALAALTSLPDDQRHAVTGRVLEDQSYAELADALRCSQSVVRQRVSRGLRTLRHRLESSR